MLNRHRLDRVQVQRNGDDLLLEGPFDCVIDGFSFVVYLDPVRSVSVSRHRQIAGYVGDEAVARGSVDAMSVVDHDGSESLRVMASPDEHPNIDVEAVRP